MLARVASSVALGYRHVVFSYTPPSQQPAPRPSASAFEHLMGTGLPDRETGADEAELSFDKALYNWLIDMCEAEKLMMIYLEIWFPCDPAAIHTRTDVCL